MRPIDLSSKLREEVLKQRSRRRGSGKDGRMSQRELSEATRSRVSVGLIRKIEQAKRDWSPSFKHVAELARVLGFSLDEMAGLQRPKPAAKTAPPAPTSSRGRTGIRRLSAKNVTIFAAQKEVPTDLKPAPLFGKLTLEGKITSWLSWQSDHTEIKVKVDSMELEQQRGEED